MNEKKPNHRPPKERAIAPEDLNKDYFTIQQVAELLHFHHQTIRKMIRTGELTATQFGRQWRIRKTDLEHFTTPK